MHVRIIAHRPRQPIGRLLLALLLGLAESALAAPQGGHITGGAGRITQTTPNETRIEQDSSRLAIDWQRFNLAPQERVQFVQPSRDAAVLNRILDQRPSEIFGRIEANGRVFLLNPNGVIFGQGARIDVGALVAGSLDLSSDDFLRGDYHLQAGADGAGAVVNRGVIAAASGGSVSLLGGRVRNEGLILAHRGQIHLAAGERAYLSFDDSGLLNFRIDGELAANPTQAASAVSNSGELRADGGEVLLTADAASRVFSEVVNNSGLISAARIDDSGGVVRLLGSGGNVIHTGRIEARGGQIAIEGERIGIHDQALLDVSGEHGGGSIHIGRTGQTRFTQIGRDARLRADAGAQGDGGEIRLWSEATTWALGGFTARGGAAGGDGGLVDISGRRGLVFDGAVDLTAAAGRTGTLLFDPTDIVIHDQADGAQGGDADLPTLSDALLGAGSFDIGELALESQANSANIVLEATNDITLNDLADDTLGLATDGSGSLTLTADSDNSGSGSIVMLDTTDRITTAGGAITLHAADMDLGGLSSNAALSDGAIDIAASGSIDIAGAIDADTANLDIAVDNDGNGAESLRIGATLSGGTVNLRGGSNGGDTLIGPDGNNAWTLTALNKGSLNGAAFSQFTGLTGGSADDYFQITSIGSLSGVIDGGGHLLCDTADYAAATSLVSVTLETTLTNIETLIGGGTDYTLTGANVGNSWLIDGQNDGWVNGIRFIDFANLTGGTANDNFVLSNGSVTGTLRGGGGTDSLTGNNTSNSWLITTADGGNVDAVFAFRDIDNLVGNAGADTFSLNGGSISGQIDGGAGSDALAANDVDNTWHISGADSGDVGGVAGFVNIENLNGKTGIDDFVFTSAGSLSGTVDGGSGQDTVNLSALSGAVVVDLGGSAYANIESFTGNNSDSTLIGPVAQNNWVIDGSNDGTLGAIGFVDFNRLQGAGDDDSFIFSGGGALSGGIDGGAGNDTLSGDNLANRWDIDAANGGQLNGSPFSDIENLVGNAMTDDFVFALGGSLSGGADGRAGNDTADFSAVAGTVTVLLGAAGYSNIESFTGNGSDSHLSGEPGLNAWDITGADSGTLNLATQFSGFNHLSGNSGDDTFVINGGGISGSITGGGGIDTLVADNLSNAWTVSGADSGSVSGVAGFSDIDNLTGNAQSDTFTFADGASISGLINGAAGSDSVDQSAQSGAVGISLSSSVYNSIETFIGNGANSTLLGDDTTTSWVISGVDSGIAATSNFVAFAHLQGGNGVDTFRLAGGDISGSIDGGGGSDELQGGDASHTWNIVGSDTGSINGQNAFSNIERLRGGGFADRFVYADGSVFSGGVDGAGGSDEVDMSAETGSVAIQLGASTFSNIESYVGNNIDSSFNADFAANTWVVTGSNSGSVNGVAFSGFNKLVGNIQSDSFAINGGAVTGSIDGGGGTDTLRSDSGNTVWNITAPDAGSLDNVNAFSAIENLLGNVGDDVFVFGNTSTITGNVDGGAGLDTVDFSAEAATVSVPLGASGFQNIESFIGNGIDSTLTGPAQNNNWFISGVNSGSVDGVSFSQFNHLAGNISSDTFIFGAGSRITGRVDGGGGLDSADFSNQTGAVNVQLGGSGFSNIETFIGNGTTSTLVGDAVDNAWVISGADDGSLGSLVFTDFNYLQGGAGRDTFILNGGTISGGIDGGAGSDTLAGNSVATDWTIDGIDAGSLSGVAAFSAVENLQGNLGADRFVFADGAAMSGVVDGLSGSDSVDQSAQTGAVTIDLGGNAYRNIETFIGNNIDSTLLGANAANSWSVSGRNSGSVGGIGFSGFTSLQGNAQDDTFDILAGGVDGLIDGGGGSDSLQAAAIDNTWDITGSDVGRVSGVGGFADIETLLGNSGADDFVFANGAAYSGLIDGGGGSDSLDHSSQAGSVRIALGGSRYLNLETFIGNNSDSTLVGDNTVNDWLISGANSGSVNGLVFRAFNHLQGNGSADDFRLAGGSLSGQLSGGGGNDSLQADDSANNWAIDGSDSGRVNGVGAFSDIDNLLGGAQADLFSLSASLSGDIAAGAGDDVIALGSGASVGCVMGGDAGNDTLRGPDVINDWRITAADAGSLNGSSFADIENLVGGSASDSFTLSNAAAAGLSGGIDGGAGDDRLSVDYSGASSRGLRFDGNTGRDRVDFTGGGTGFANTFVLGTGGADDRHVVSTGVTTVQQVDLQGIEALTDAMTAATFSLDGSSGDDTYALAGGGLAGSDPLRIDVAARLPVDVANKTDVNLSGGAGNDSIDISADAQLTGTLQLAAETLRNGAGATLTADRLQLDAVTQGGTAVDPLQTRVDTLAITGNSGSLFLREADGLRLSAENVGGSLSLESLAGDIGSDGPLVVNGSTTLRVADGGSIRLSDPANAFGGTLQFVALSGRIADLSLRNSGATAIQPLDISGDLSLVSAGDLSQSGPLLVAGNSYFDAAEHGIDLSNSGNRFTGSVSLNTSGGRAVTLHNGLALNLAASTLGSGSLSLSGEGIAQNGALVQAAAGGAVTLDAGSGAIELNNAGNVLSGVVSLRSDAAQPVTIVDVSQLQLGAVSSQGGDITATAGAGITVSGNVRSHGGDISLSAKGGDIDLGHLDANDGGSIILFAPSGALNGDNSLITKPNLSARHLVIDTGTTLGDFNNPIAVNVADGGTSLFVAGEGSAHIIGLAGTILAGSVKVNNVSATLQAIDQAQETAIQPLPSFVLDDEWRQRLYIIVDGGVRMPTE